MNLLMAWLSILALLFAGGSTPASARPEASGDTARPDSSQTPAPAQSTATGPSPTRIWYLHHSGWAVETRNHLLVFDFIPPESQDTVPKLVARLQTEAEGQHRRTVVFVSHEHPDHYSRAIDRWQKRVPSITYVYGWKVREAANRLILGPRADTLMGALRIRTIRSTDLGVGFLVRVDSLVIFHAGDHAQWEEADRPAYDREIDWLAGFGERVDIAFLPIATGAACEPLESIRVGAANALVKLRPAVAFPMHVMCVDRLALYRQFAEGAKAFAGGGTVLYAERLGDGFAYDARSHRAWRLDSEPR